MTRLPLMTSAALMLTVLASVPSGADSIDFAGTLTRWGSPVEGEVDLRIRIFDGSSAEGSFQLGRFNDTTNVWSSWNGLGTPGGSPVEIIDWGGGMDAAGSGFYPFSVQDYPSQSEWWTNQIHTDHAHSISGDHTSHTRAGYLPYTQLILCRKD